MRIKRKLKLLTDDDIKALIDQISADFNHAQCVVCGAELGPVGEDANHHLMDNPAIGIVGFFHYCAEHCPECNGDKHG